MVPQVTPDARGDNDLPDLSVVLVFYNTHHLVDRLFTSLEAAIGALRVEVIVVDNASTDGSAARVRTRAPYASIISNPTNVGFGRANNQAISRARGRHLLLLNTDAFVSPDTLRKTVDLMDAHPEFGVVGVRLLGQDGSAQPSCRYFPTPWNLFLAEACLSRFLPGARLIDDVAGDPPQMAECDWVPGCYYLVRREAIERVGAFDPRYFLYYEEVDHCRSIKACGWKVVFFPHTSVCHLGGESARSLGSLRRTTRQVSSLHLESELLYIRKHYGALGLAALWVLMLAARLINAARSILKGSGSSALAELRGSSSLSGLLRRTQFGLRPTR